MVNSSISHQWRITLPTLITCVRILLVPFIIKAMVASYWGIASILFFIAAVTDLLDGLLARRLNQQTVLGAVLDPLADKFLILACFFTLAFVQGPHFGVPLWFVLIVLGKELLLIMGIVLLYFKFGSVPMHPAIVGKAAMLVQTLFIFWLFACYFFHWMPVKTYYTMLGAVLVMISAALIHYIYIGITQLRSS